VEHGTVKRAFEAGFFCCENGIFDTDLPTTEKCVYMALTRYAGSNNRAWPSYDTLAKDCSCSRRRAISAVDVLTSSGLVVKEKRGNRTNNYLVYPPSYYCSTNIDKNGEKIKQGAESAPQNDDLEILYQTQGEMSAPSGVNEVHPQGEPAAPSGCKSCTLGVNEVHPKNNSNNNIKNNTSTEKSESEDNLNSKKITEEDIEAIRKTFKAKKVTVKDHVIKDLLANNSVEEVKAAIKSCDFETARNPIAVIRWMLTNGTYIMPAENENKTHVSQDDYKPQVNDTEVRNMIAGAKSILKSKVARTGAS